MRASLSFIFGFVVAGLLTSSITSAQQPGQGQLRPATAVQQNNSQSETTVKEAIAKKMMMANQMEIELAQLAQQKSKNERVSQLADTLISDHKNLNEKLQQWKTKNNSSEGRSNSTVNTPRATSQPANQPGIQQGNRQNLGQQQSPNQQDGKHTVPETLCKIMDKASSNALEMTKEMLQKYEGEEFDMAFVGQQTVGHMMLLAELRAIEGQDLGQISQIAGQAATTTDQHLQELKQLAKELKDNSSKN